jgi:hypothetical protein
MKIIAILFALLFYCSASNANTNAYGAWWETREPFAAKSAGELFILFEGDVTSHLGTGGVVTISMVYNANGDRYEISGSYRRRVGDFVSFEASPTNLTFLSSPAWKGRLKLRSGQCEGRWRNPGLHGPAPGGGRYILKAIRGRFLSHVPLPRPIIQDP